MPLGYVLALFAMAAIALWAVWHDLRIWVRVRWRTGKRRDRTTQEKP